MPLENWNIDVELLKEILKDLKIGLEWKERSLKRERIDENCSNYKKA